jgi:hypothetical protein
VENKGGIAKRKVGEEVASEEAKDLPLGGVNPCAQWNLVRTGAR